MFLLTSHMYYTFSFRSLGSFFAAWGLHRFIHWERVTDRYHLVFGLTINAYVQAMRLFRIGLLG